MSSTMALHGESLRMLLWSDLFMKMIPMPDVEEDVYVPVCWSHSFEGSCLTDLFIAVNAFSVLADDAKHNQDGHIDEHGALRYHCVELCPVGGLVMHFFSHFHILGMPVPNFEPEFSTPGYREFGKQEWYSYHVFWTKELVEEMSNNSMCQPWLIYSLILLMMGWLDHQDYVTKIHKANDVSITKVTHATHPYAAQTARENGAPISSTKALGGWSESGSYQNCYDHALPLEALLGATMFNAQKPET